MSGPDVASFGALVRRYRTERGVSQEELARAVGRSRTMITAIEGGHRHVRIDELMIFAQVLEVSPMALLGVGVNDASYRRGYRDGYRAGVDAAVAAVRSLDSADAA